MTFQLKVLHQVVFFWTFPSSWLPMNNTLTNNFQESFGQLKQVFRLADQRYVFTYLFII